MEWSYTPAAQAAYDECQRRYGSMVADHIAANAEDTAARRHPSGPVRVTLRDWKVCDCTLDADWRKRHGY